MYKSRIPLALALKLATAQQQQQGHQYFILDNPYVLLYLSIWAPSVAPSTGPLVRAFHSSFEDYGHGTRQLYGRHSCNEARVVSNGRRVRSI
jgi:hypothetical protein